MQDRFPAMAREVGVRRRRAGLATRPMRSSRDREASGPSTPIGESSCEGGTELPATTTPFRLCSPPRFWTVSTRMAGRRCEASGGERCTRRSTSLRCLRITSILMRRRCPRSACRSAAPCHFLWRRGGAYWGDVQVAIAPFHPFQLTSLQPAREVPQSPDEFRAPARPATRWRSPADRTSPRRPAPHRQAGSSCRTSASRRTAPPRRRPTVAGRAALPARASASRRRSGFPSDLTRRRHALRSGIGASAGTWCQPARFKSASIRILVTLRALDSGRDINAVRHDGDDR